MRRRIVWIEDDLAVQELKALRKSVGVSQRELASILGCAVSHVCKIEKHSQHVSIGEFIGWCKALGIEPSEAIARILESP